MMGKGRVGRWVVGQWRQGWNNRSCCQKSRDRYGETKVGKIKAKGSWVSLDSQAWL